MNASKIRVLLKYPYMVSYVSATTLFAMYFICSCSRACLFFSMRKITQADIRSIIKNTAAVFPAAAPAKDFSLLNMLSPLCKKAR